MKQTKAAFGLAEKIIIIINMGKIDVVGAVDLFLLITHLFRELGPSSSRTCSL